MLSAPPVQCKMKQTNSVSSAMLDVHFVNSLTKILVLSVTKDFIFIKENVLANALTDLELLSMVKNVSQIAKFQ